MFRKYKKLRKKVERLIVKLEDKYSDTDVIKASYILQDLYDLIGEKYDEIPFKIKR